MCVHREHRTGNCRECHPIAPAWVGERGPELVNLGKGAQAIPMPDRWEGDDN